MGDASSTTLRRKQRVLYAHRVIKQAAFDKGLIGHMGLEGGGRTAMTYSPHYYDIKDGAIKTTLQEQQSYIDGTPINISGDGGGGGGGNTHRHILCLCCRHQSHCRRKTNNKLFHRWHLNLGWNGKAVAIRPR